MRDRDYPFSEDVIVDETGAVYPNWGVMAKVSSLIEVLRLGGSYELVYRHWEQFTLSAIRVNVDVTWSWLVVINCSRMFYVAHVHSGHFLSVHHPEWDVPADSFALFDLGKVTRELQCGV